MENSNFYFSNSATIQSIRLTDTIAEPIFRTLPGESCLLHCIDISKVEFTFQNCLQEETSLLN